MVGLLAGSNTLGFACPQQAGLKQHPDVGLKSNALKLEDEGSSIEVETSSNFERSPVSQLRFDEGLADSPVLVSQIDSADAESSNLGEIEAVDVSVAAEFFESRVRPVLVEHCYECHSGGESSGGLLLDTAMATRRGGDTGPAVVPGDLELSLLVKAIRYEDQDFQMPPSGKLPDSKIRDLEQWIEKGGYDPRNLSASESDPVSSGPGMSIEEGRDFWSMQPVQEPMVPAINHDWIQTPIDAFIVDGLTKAGIGPAMKADRRTLIRRLKYDLLGLPPSMDEIEAFENDPSPHAYRSLVDHYLASEQYGVRWGRHWLDVARYADSNGLDENLAFGNAWRYRDYVVDAFNLDMAYDQFVQEQLAGDLLPESTQSAKIATGFLVLGAKVLAEPDRDKLEMDTIDEQLDTLGKAFLGMTFGCVRCHDHKFDPITQRDYYSLAAIFKSTQTFGETNTGAIKHWNEYVFADESQLQVIKEVDDRIAALKKEATDFKNKAYGELRAAVRSKATEYLVAATQVDLSMSLREVDSVARPNGLHARVLHHCRRHLEFNRENPVFAKWHELLGGEHSELVEAFYRPWFERASEFKPGKVASDEASEAELDSAELEIARQTALYHGALMDTSGFLAIPPKPDHAFDESTFAEYDQLMEAARLFESSAPDAASAMGVKDGEISTELAIHVRGSHRNLGAMVSRDVPEVMRGVAGVAEFDSERSGRLALARWMTSPSHPLTARVYVNRLWRWHFGSGLVGSTENFGVLGDRPIHQNLLDWLAFQFGSDGWSTKKLHRMILLSSVYQQGASNPSESVAREKDPENRLHWKYPMLRLEAEQLHDSVLSVCGRLDFTLGGKSVPLRNRQFVFNHTSVDHTKYDSLRRAIYLPVIRNNLFTTFEQFDFPDPTMPTGNRASTVVAPQALLLLNSEMVAAASHDLACQLLKISASDESRIEMAFQRVLGRKPDREEMTASRSLVMGHASSPSGAELAWSTLCQSLLATNEFIYIK